MARLMREMGIYGVSRRKSTRTTLKAQSVRKAPDLVKRDFTVATVNKLWGADITYVPTWSGFLYLSVVIDAFSRRVVGWAIATHLQSELINRRSFRTHKEARLAIFSYIEGWYNPHRRHSSIAYYAPIAYEKLHQSQA